MSIYTLERVLWDLHTDPLDVDSFKSNPEEFLSRYPLTADEQHLVNSMDVRAMADSGVSEMLLFCSWQAVNGGAPSIPDYMQRMNTPVCRAD